MADFNIALVGECMIELQQVGQHLRKGFGGDTLNTAVYLSRLTAGKNVNVSYVTALGEDKISQEMLDSWRSEGINTELVQRAKAKLPGLYMVETASDELIEALVKQDAIYLSGISLAILPATSRARLYDLLARCKAAGGKIIFDNNYRPQLWRSAEEAAEHYQHILSVTHTALLTFDDEQAVFGDTKIEQCIERTQALGVQEMVLKQGGQECVVVSQEHCIRVAAQHVAKEKVIDTNAAGDSFAAGYMSKRLLGAAATDAAKKAHQVAATVIQHQGAIIDAKFITPCID
ncbi:sugar kinase [Motilimonas cestriensis]|uniref:sugar kinase n=1 Tax=Motilimonas cestriensis TaxID=2742685 RepID=UPI003DA32CAC